MGGVGCLLEIFCLCFALFGGDASRHFYFFLGGAAAGAGGGAEVPVGVVLFCFLFPLKCSLTPRTSSRLLPSLSLSSPFLHASGSRPPAALGSGAQKIIAMKFILPPDFCWYPLPKNGVYELFEPLSPINFINVDGVLVS